MVGRSLEQGVACGATCHWVDAGIDTGDLIERRLLRVDPDWRTLDELQRANRQNMVDLLVDVTARAAAGQVLRRVGQTARFPYCRWLSAAEQAALAGPLAAGRAQQLFDHWKNAGCDPETLSLRDDFVAPELQRDQPS